MERITLHAPAKINLTLDVTGRRDDGYHTIRSVMQAVDLCDRVTVTRRDTPGVELVLSDLSLPTDSRNTAVRAAEVFAAQAGLPFGVTIEVEKHIPQQAGMAGGSADAAGVLAALNILTGSRVTAEELCRMGAHIGADVPFCLRGGCALAEGIGEILTPVTGLPDMPLVVVKPPVGVSTAEAYRRVDETVFTTRPDTDGMLRALQAQDGAAIGAILGNVFETAMALPEVAAIRKAMAEHHPLGSRMTGSGSAVVALFADEDAAVACAADLAALGAVYLCRPCSTGPFAEE